MEKEKLTQEAEADFTAQLSDFIRGLGLKLFGFTDEAAIARYGAYYKKRPPGFHSAFEEGAMADKCAVTGRFISLAFPYAHDLGPDLGPRFSVYTRGRDYHVVAGEYLREITDYIRGLGYSARAFTDSNELPERLIAALSGVGYLGRNSTLITKLYGSYVFLGEIQTDLPLTSSQSYVAPGDYTLCGDCQNCSAACPAGILGGPYVEAGRCLSEVTQKKYNTQAELKLLKGRLFGCDTCQRVCPHNKDKAGLGLEEFMPLPQMSRPDLWSLVRLSKADFRAHYAVTSAGWRGKAVLAKNALAALADRGELPGDLTFESTIARAAYELLTQQNRGGDPLKKETK